MKFVAHRGYSRQFPENTLPAFQAVIDHRLNGSAVIGIELDIHLTGDGHIPVMHETSIADDRGTPHPVAQLSFSELQRLHQLRCGKVSPAVPSIRQVLDLINHRTELCFEIKIGSYNLERFTRLFVEALSTYQPQGDVVISSFSYEILEFVRPFCEQFNLRYGYIFKSADALTMVPADVRRRFDLLHPWYRLLFDSPEIFSRETPPIRCWTVDDAKTISGISRLSLPVEAVMTDDISLAESFIDGAV